MPADTTALTVDTLKKRFGQFEVLKGISLTARDGDVISILGSSGSGKSTFLRCINLLETPDSGVVTVAGETIKMRKKSDGTAEPTDRKQVDRIRSELGMVFQSFNLWSHLTVLENLIEAPVHVQKRPRKECIEEAKALLARVGMSERADYYPVASVRRPAAARGHRPRARHAAESHAVRRADLGARSRSSSARSCASCARSPKKGARCSSSRTK